MIGIDTNILVRFLVGDDAQQSKRVYKLFKKTEDQGEVLFVPTLVVLELMWVLESVYGIAREPLLHSLSELLSMPIFQFENKRAIQEFIPAAQKTKFDVSDLLIAHSAATQACESLLTFDKKASKYKLFTMM